MKLVKTIIDLDVYGEKVELKKPTYKEAQDYRDELLKLKDNESATEVMKQFLFKMGLPLNTFDQLEIAHVSELMEALTDSKKK